METLEKYLALRTFVNETEKRGLVYGTTFTEFLILRSINDQGDAGIRRVDLAEQVGLTISGITRALQSLEKLGYTDTQDETLDARVKKVVLTKSGADLFSDIEKDVQRLMDEVAPELNSLY